MHLYVLDCISSSGSLDISYLSLVGMKPTISSPLLCGLFLIFSSCASVKPYYADPSQGIPSGQESSSDANIKYSLYLVGGAPLLQPSPVLAAIESDRKNRESGLILLGDVLSIDDLHLKSADSTAVSPEALSQFKNLDDSFRDLFLIPGQKRVDIG